MANTNISTIDLRDDGRVSQQQLLENSINPSSAFDQQAMYLEDGMEEGEEEQEDEDVKLMFENTGTKSVVVFAINEFESDREEEICTVEAGMMKWWDGGQTERTWIIRDVNG